jgi:hypothetical protein
VLLFSAAGSQLGFTPDGGLLAYGAVPPADLTWGYVSGGNYAQQAGPVQAGAYHMPGTFLRGDQTTLDPTVQPAVLLFTGFGDDSNPSYFERPANRTTWLGRRTTAGSISGCRPTGAASSPAKTRALIP